MKNSLRKLMNAFLIVLLTVVVTFVAHGITAWFLDKPIYWDKLIAINIVLCVGVVCYFFRRE